MTIFFYHENPPMGGGLSWKELLTHPRIGASWEGYAVEEVLSQLQPDQAYFWATHQGAELDLLLFKDGRRLGIEIKRADAPTITPSMRSALADLNLEQLVVLYPGSQTYELEPRVRVLPIDALAGATIDALFPKKRRTRARRGRVSDISV